MVIADDRNMGAESLLHKYLQHLIKYASQVLRTASEIGSRSSKHFYIVSNVLKCTGVGKWCDGGEFSEKLKRGFLIVRPFCRSVTAGVVDLFGDAARRDAAFVA